jgi:hypothetical protein
MNYWRPVIGSWRTKIEVAGQVLEGSLAVTLSPTNQCYITHGKGGPQPESHNIGGFDVELQRWKVFGFDSDGNHYTEVTTVDFSKAKTIAKGASWTTERKQVATDGTVTKTISIVVVEEFDEDSWKVRASTTVQGKPEPELTVVGERVE